MQEDKIIKELEHTINSTFVKIAIKDCAIEMLKNEEILATKTNAGRILINGKEAQVQIVVTTHKPFFIDDLGVFKIIE